MKRYLSIIFAILLLAGSEVRAEVVIGTVLLNGSPIPAEYTILPDSTVGLGSGANACISQYSAGRVVVPEQIRTSEVDIFGRETNIKVYNVTEVMPMAFRFCDQLKRVQFREGITRIGDFAFKGCRKIGEIELPSTLKSVGTGAFIDMNSLYLMTCNSETPPVWEYNDVFFLHQGGISDNQIYTHRPGVFLFVPSGSEEAYKNSAFSDPTLNWTTPEGWGTAFANFNGSALENFYITNEIDLEDVRRIANDSRFGDIQNVWLEADIEMSDTIWPTPIGNDPNRPFKANVHGQGHTINGLRVQNDDAAGLFGYCVGNTISGIRLHDARCFSKGMAAGLVASAQDCRIDSCYIEGDAYGDTYVGGIVAKLTGRNTMDRCVSEVGINWLNRDAEPYTGGLVGYATGTPFTNCAVLTRFNTGNKSGHFVGASDASNPAVVDYCYTLNDLLSTTQFGANVIVGKNIIVYGQPMSFLDYQGDKSNATWHEGNIQCTFPASVLGVDAWIYAWDHLPLPDCFIDRWPVRENLVVYGSEGAMKGRDNVLTPTDDIPAEAWSDLSKIGFRRYPFKASRLRINNSLNVISLAQQLPLGISEQITSTNGVVHNEVLHANYQGTEDIMKPVYEVDEDNNFILDKDGNLILLGEEKLGEREIWEPVGYAISLPYDVTFGANAKLYQPTSIYDVEGQTTAMFEPVRDNRAEPFHPYYLVVYRDSVILGSEAPVTCTPLEGAITQVGDFLFSGSMSNTDSSARRNNTYTLKDGKWQRESATDAYYAKIEPFSSFFRSVSSTSVSSIAIELGDDNPVISVGDFYFTLNTLDNTATLTGYHGRGGNTVVPATIPTAIGGLERQIPVTKLNPDIFAKCTAEIWSIDLSRCLTLEPVAIERTVQGNPFYKVSERTIIYMPEGKVKVAESASESLRNVVIGTECAKLDITDGWDFRPPYDFHASEAYYDRILYAAKQKDGSYKSYAYTVCLPFDVNLTQQRNDGMVDIMRAWFYTENNELLFSNESPVLSAGKGYFIRVNRESVQLNATDVMVKAQPTEIVELYMSKGTDLQGTWQGTFTTIKNEDAAQMNICTLNSNNSKWCRIRSDEGRYRNAWVGPFRAFFIPDGAPILNSYASMFQKWVQGENSTENPVIPFDADFYSTDTDFSAYDYDDANRIGSIHNSQFIIHNEADAMYDLSGRKINSQFSTLNSQLKKGLYIVNGKKVIY